MAGKCVPETANLESDQSLSTELANMTPLAVLRWGWLLHRLMSANTRKYFVESGESRRFPTESGGSTSKLLEQILTDFLFGIFLELQQLIRALVEGLP